MGESIASYSNPLIKIRPGTLIFFLISVILFVLLIRAKESSKSHKAEIRALELQVENIKLKDYNDIKKTIRDMDIPTDAADSIITNWEMRFH